MKVLGSISLSGFDMCSRLVYPSLVHEPVEVLWWYTANIKLLGCWEPLKVLAAADV
jgi:hypothetical protein